MRRLTTATALTAATLIVLAGCSSDGDDDKRSAQIPGKDVAAKAETALQGEAENLAEGGFSCPDVDRKKGATATCTRSSEAEGYYLTVDGEVEITEISGDDFGLHVQMEDALTSFGQSGDTIETDLSQQAETKFGSAPTDVTCPDLEGRDGATVTCTLEVDGEEKAIEVTASEVDISVPSMSYSFREV